MAPFHPLGSLGVAFTMPSFLEGALTDFLKSLQVANPGTELREILLGEWLAHACVCVCVWGWGGTVSKQIHPTNKSRRGFCQQGLYLLIFSHFPLQRQPSPDCTVALPSWGSSTKFRKVIAKSPFWLLIMVFVLKSPGRNSSAPDRCLFLYLDVRPFYFLLCMCDCPTFQDRAI